jgi:hypothetical protein
MLAKHMKGASAMVHQPFSILHYTPSHITMPNIRATAIRSGAGRNLLVKKFTKGLDIPTY